MPRDADRAQAKAHDVADRVARKFQMNEAGYRQLKQLWMNMSASDASADGVHTGTGSSSSADATGDSDRSGTADDRTGASYSRDSGSGSDTWGAPGAAGARGRGEAAELALAHQRALQHARERQDEERRQRQELEEQLVRATQTAKALGEEVGRLRQELEAAEFTNRMKEREVAHQALVTQERLDEALGRLQELDEGGRRAAAALRDSLAEQLFVGDEQSRRLRALPAEQLGVADWVRLRVHDAQQEVQRQLNELSAQTDALRTEARAATEARVKAETDCAQAQREAASAREREDQCQRRCAALEQEMVLVAKRSDDDRVKLLQADRVLEEREEARQELAKVRADRDELARKAAILAEELQKVQREASDGMSKVWEAATQREAHEQIVAVLRKREQELELEKGRWQQRAEDLQQQLDLQGERFRKELAAAREESEQRREKEVGRVQEQAARDIQSVRERTDALKSRELAQLTSERDSASQEAQRLRLRVDELEGAMRQERSEWRRVDDATKAECAELRASLRLAKLDSQRLEMLREELKQSVAQLQLQVECDAQKLAAARDEVYDARRQHDEERAHLQAQLAARSEKLRVLEDLEANCDEAIERTGAMLQPGEEQAAAASLAQVPSAPGRRIQQALLLANKAMRLGKELAAAQEQLQQRGVALQRAQQELERVKGVLGNQQQPYQYFVDTLARRDADLDRLSSELRLARSDVKEADNERHALEQHCAQLQARLAASQTELLRLQSRHHEFRDYLAGLKLLPAADETVQALPENRRKRKKKRDPQPVPFQEVPVADHTVAGGGDETAAILISS
eukprot:TRINITY_DN21910_c0_g1_i1.p1 TRINITY_DN21910_c0_g1~~TRINITY_DN21910_c0_g1_i1.p1  ORF type:complete len:836 (+),score=346.83 TRINITY_DN21910_c0_g1_i1:75-2510(+)